MGREGKYGVEGQGQEGQERCEVVQYDVLIWERLTRGYSVGRGDKQTEEAGERRRGGLG